MSVQQQQLNIKPFDGDGFSNWEFRVRLILEQNSVVEVIDSDISTSTDAKVIEQYKKNDIKARNIIVQSVTDNVLTMIKHKKTAKAMMETLKNTYGKRGIKSQVLLQKRWRNLEFSGQSSLNEFLIEFESAYFDIVNSGGKIEEKDVVIQLLSVMSEEYNSLISAIDILLSTNESSVTLDYVKNQLLQEEERLKRNSGIEFAQPQHAFISNRQIGWQNQRIRNSNSRFQGRGYVQNQNRFPSRSQLDQPTINSFRGKCYACQIRGHRRSECPNMKQSNVYITEDNREEEIAFVSNSLPVSGDKYSNGCAEKLIFVIDSGATRHLIKSEFKNYLCDIKNVDHQIGVAKVGESVSAKSQGNLHLSTCHNYRIKLSDVLACDNLAYNLMSVKKIEEKGLKIIFESKQVKVMKGDSLILMGELVGNLYLATVMISDDKVNMIEDSPALWHRRMGHSSRYPTNMLCDICLQGKQTRLPFLKSIPENKKATRVLQYVSSDVCGKISPPTHDGMIYFVSFIDHFTHFAHVYLIKSKSEVEDKFKKYVALVEAKFNCKIENLRCDNGGEYVSKSFQKFCADKGINIQFNVPRNPEQNGVAERYNRTVLDKARCIILDSKLDKEFWGEAVLTSVYLTNRTQTSALTDNVTPAELWYGSKPDLNKIRLFGCHAYTHIPKEDRCSKFDARSKKMIFMGYCNNGYRLWDSERRRIVTARSVIFDETMDNKIRTTHILDDTENQFHNSESLQPISQSLKKDDEESQTQDVSLRRSTRTRQLPKHLEDFDVDLMLALSTGCLLHEVPKNYKEAIRMGNGWKEAIDEELESLQQNGTWELVRPPLDAKIIDSRWVFVEKTINGELHKKARLVAKGFQQQCLDDDVYAPVARMVTLRSLLAISAECKLQIHQLDVKSAFLKSKLKDVVYMNPPDGLSVESPELVCKLVKALYGLRQSPHCWNEHINKYLLDMNFERSKVDPCLYFNAVTFILIWVDDLLLMSRSIDDLTYVKNKLMNVMDIRDLSSNNGKLVFLGLEIENYEGKITISQKNLIRKVINHFNMNECKISKIPVQPKLDLAKGEMNSYCNVPYKELLGSLMYIMLGSRPDICFAVSYFGRFQNCFNDIHWKYLKNVLRYLKLTEDFGLVYQKFSDFDVVVNAFVDSDFANDINDRKSMSGFIIRINNNVVCWNSKKQCVVALSSCESEYIALSLCITECLFLGQLLQDICYPVYPIYVYEDNQASIKMAHTYETKRSKHIDIKHHFVKDLVNQGRVIVKYVPSNEQLADLMTKALPETKFIYFRENINVTKI